MIRIFIYSMFLLLLSSVNTIMGQDSDSKLEIRIEQRNVMTGKAGVYIIKGKRIKRMIRHSDKLVLPKISPVFLSKQDNDSITSYVIDIIDNLDNNTSYVDARVLDGWDMSLIIKQDSIDYKYRFSNCSCEFVNELIQFINLRLDKKALINRMDFMGENKCN